jgi:hypothetical protein
MGNWKFLSAVNKSAEMIFNKKISENNHIFLASSFSNQQIGSVLKKKCIIYL